MTLFFIILLTVTLAVFALQKGLGLKPSKKPNLKPLLPIIRFPESNLPAKTVEIAAIMTKQDFTEKPTTPPPENQLSEPPTNLPI